MRRPENMTLQATVQGEQRDRSRAKSSSSGNHNQDDTTSTLADKFSWPGRIAVLLALLLSPWANASVHHWAHRYILLALLVGLGFWPILIVLANRQWRIL